MVFPSDPMQAYLDLGQTYEYYSDYFNPGHFFDEVYSLSPWGNARREVHENVTYIKSNPRNFRKIITDIKPNVVRAYGGYHCADWLAMNLVEGIPTVVSVHDTNPNLIFDSIKYADNIVCMAKCVQDAVRKKVDCTGKGEWVMGNRVDTSLFSRTVDDGLNDKLNERFGTGRHVLHVGRKSEQKNLDTVIRALQHLPEDVSAVFVGRGDFSPYEKLAKDIGVIGRVHNVDHVDNVELPKWYTWCDCFCTPSRWEGFGFVFIEAASCETPIVTSDIGPMNEYLSNDINSILVREYENPEAIAKAILLTFENSDGIARMKKNARNVGLHFSKESVDSQEMAIYEEIIKRGPRERSHLSFVDRKKMEWKYRKY